MVEKLFRYLPMLFWSGKAVVQNVLAIAPCSAVNQSSHLSAYHFPKLPYTTAVGYTSNEPLFMFSNDPSVIQCVQKTC